MNKVIYSCVTGGYDDIPVHKYVAPGWDYVLFTDNQELIAQGKFAHWTIRPLLFNKSTNVKNARWHKINAHTIFPEYDYSLWLDSNIIINNNHLFKIIVPLIKKDILVAVPNHPERKCIYDEAEIIKQCSIDYPKIVDKEMKFLKTKKYPKNNGLSETCILLRKHNSIKSALNLWWKMVKKYSKRDQLSFNYTLWKTNTSYTSIYTNEQGFGVHRLCSDFTFVFKNSHNQNKVTVEKQQKSVLKMLKDNRKNFPVIKPINLCRQELLQWYKNTTGRDLNLDNPQTFNEKIQWLKLYDSTPIKTRLADKFLVRRWVARKIGKKYLIPLLGVYDSFDEIDFDKLPNEFVIKCNHGSGYNIIVSDKSKLDLDDARKKINSWMSEDFAFKNGCELHYHNIKHKIIIESFVSNDGKALWDYKFWCFNGRVKYMQFRDDFSSDLKMAFYDLNWNKQPFYYDHPLYDKNLEKPDNFDKMIKIAKKLCKGFPMVCVDLYRLNNGEIKFGEMTFTRSSGIARWNDEKYNKMLGDMIVLPVHEYDLKTGKYRWAHRDMKYNISIPVIKYSKHDNKTKLNIFGTQVFKLKNTEKDYIIYLFGLQVYKRHISNGYAKINVCGIRVWKYKL